MFTAHILWCASMGFLVINYTHNRARCVDNLCFKTSSFFKDYQHVFFCYQCMIGLKNEMHTRCSSMQNSDYKSKTLLNQIIVSIVSPPPPPPTHEAHISNNSIKVGGGGGGGGELSVSSCSNIYMIGDTAHPSPPPTHTYSIIYNMIVGKLNKSVELHVCERRGAAFSF